MYYISKAHHHRLRVVLEVDYLWPDRGVVWDWDWDGAANLFLRTALVFGGSGGHWALRARVAKAATVLTRSDTEELLVPREKLLRCVVGEWKGHRAHLILRWKPLEKDALGSRRKFRGVLQSGVP